MAAVHSTTLTVAAPRGLAPVGKKEIKKAVLRQRYANAVARSMVGASNDRPSQSPHYL